MSRASGNASQEDFEDNDLGLSGGSGGDTQDLLQSGADDNQNTKTASGELSGYGISAEAPSGTPQAASAIRRSSSGGTASLLNSSLGSGSKRASASGELVTAPRTASKTSASGIAPAQSSRPASVSGSRAPSNPATPSQVARGSVSGGSEQLGDDTLGDTADLLAESGESAPAAEARPQTAASQARSSAVVQSTAQGSISYGISAEDVDEGHVSRTPSQRAPSRPTTAGRSPTTPPAAAQDDAASIASGSGSLMESQEEEVAASTTRSRPASATSQRSVPLTARTAPSVARQESSVVYEGSVAGSVRSGRGGSVAPARSSVAGSDDGDAAYSEAFEAQSQSVAQHSQAGSYAQTPSQARVSRVGSQQLHDDSYSESPRPASARPPRPGTAASQRGVTMRSVAESERYDDDDFTNDGNNEYDQDQAGMDEEYAAEHEYIQNDPGHDDDNGSWDGALSSHRSALAGANTRRVRSARHPMLASSMDKSVRTSTMSARSASAPRARPRPVSAMVRTAGMMDDIMARDPATWDVRDVCQWVEHIGLGQYRKKFAHNCIDGHLLLGLSDDQLRLELGIGPLGHRVALKNMIAQLSAGEAEDDSPQPVRTGRFRPHSAPQDEPRRPASAGRGLLPPDNYLGPAAGKMTVYEQRAKLLFELDRAQSRAMQNQSVVATLAATADQAQEEVKRIRALLNDIERRHKMELTQTAGAIDSSGRIPWRPAGPKPVMDPHPERFAKLRDHPTVDCTFKPRINKNSQKLISDSYGQDATAADFLSRLANDMRKRARNKKEADKKYYSEEALYNDPALQKKRFNRDFEFLREYCASKYQMALSESPGDYEQELNQVLESDTVNLRLNDKEKQLEALMNKQGPKKIAAMATYIRSLMFMDRYSSEIRQQASKKKELERRWWERTMPASAQPEAKERDDLNQCDKYFTMLGWIKDSPDDNAVTDERLNALLLRAYAYRAEWEKQKEIDRTKPPDMITNFPEVAIDWEVPKWRNDGLQSLQEAEWERQAADLAMTEQTASARQQGGDSTTVRTGHAPTGTITISSAEPNFKNYLHYTVKLLGGCRSEDLDKLLKLKGRAKRVAVYRALRTQKFLEFTDSDLKNRDKKLQQAYEELAPKKRVVSKEELDDFYDRLLNDAYKRREKAERANHDKLSKEKEIVGSSTMYSGKRGYRPTSARF